MRIKYIPVDMDNVTDFSHSPNSNFLYLSFSQLLCSTLGNLQFWNYFNICLLILGQMKAERGM